MLTSSPAKILKFPANPVSSISTLLDSLLDDLTSLRTVDSVTTLSALAVEIATRQIKLASVLSALANTPLPTSMAMSDRSLTVEEAAERIGCSKQWLYRHGKELPFSRKLSHRQRRFSERGIERWQKMSAA